MLISGGAPSATLCLTPRTEAKGLSATACRVTRPSKKWRSAARVWIFVGPEPSSWPMYTPARPVHGELLLKRRSVCGIGHDSVLARRTAADRRFSWQAHCHGLFH